MPTIDLSATTTWRLKEFLPSGWVRDDIADAALGDPDDWIAATVPGSVQRAVVAAGLAPDPFVGRNSLACEWIADRTWVYHTRFEAEPLGAGERRRLTVGGVDYAARFILNGSELGRHEGMSTPISFDATDAVSSDQPNDLLIVLAPAPREQDQMGRTSLVRSRKTRMGYWWDFCPRLIDLGIVGDVTLASGALFVDDVRVTPTLAADRISAMIDVQARASGSAANDAPVLARVLRSGAVVAEARTQVDAEGRASATLAVDEPELWWPNGHGDQALYEVQLTVGDGSASPVTVSRTVGLRSIELAPNDGAEPDAPPYVFVVNGRRIYVNGWNWVPVDALYADPQPHKVRHLLELAALSHANLVRVNGVGRIETQQFYDECDRLGLMVWQEFLLTSSATDRKPASDDEYLSAVVAEAREIVPLVSHHASLALWCAGNELEGLDKIPLDDAEPVIGALKSVAAELDPDTVWLPTSARGRKPFNGPNSIREDPGGLQDVHGPWLYQGLEQQYSLYNIGTSLFHSEIGAEAITNPETARAVLPEEEWTLAQAQSPTWRHTSAWWVRPEQWGEYFGGLDLTGIAFDRLVAATQFLQAEGVRYAIESNRRRAFGNSGSLPWQFNEPFPMVGSTAAVDYHGRPKHLFTAVRAAYAPLALSAAYDRIAWGGLGTAGLRLWAANADPVPRPGRLVAQALDGAGRILDTLEVDVTVPASASVHVADFAVPLVDVATGLFVLDLAFVDASGERRAHHRTVLSAEESLAPLIRMPETVIDATLHGDTLRLHNAGDALAPVVRIHDTRLPGLPGWLVPADDHLVLLPGETREVGLNWCGVPPTDRKITVTALNAPPVRL
ncbi:glycoside hydrolase family 2 protein [Leifsonia sp. NPDC058292]|uniref:glycoside hydrolase family 2 protein n=1 Tax=Leifsonia sp. NPDC058292 TaxID=3346428 RepID=UPI0036DE68A0